MPCSTISYPRRIHLFEKLIQDDLEVGKTCMLDRENYPVKSQIRICWWRNTSFSSRRNLRVAYSFLNFKTLMCRSDIIRSNNVFAIKSSADLSSLNMELVLLPFSLSTIIEGLSTVLLRGHSSVKPCQFSTPNTYQGNVILAAFLF